MALLDVSDLRCRFGGLVALDGVTCAVAEGHIQGVIGPNGAGKTTFFNVVTGILRPTAGTVRFDGVDITGRPPHAIASLGIARTFQNVRLYEQMTALENVLVGLHRHGRAGLVAAALRLPWQVAEEARLRVRAREHLAFTGVGAFADVPVSAMPFGRRRMVELARALAVGPRLLLLDEPASGLNPRETSELADMVRRIRDSGVTVLLVEHDMALVMDVCDRVLALNFGQPIAEGPPAQIQADPRVIAVYLGGDPAHAVG